VIDPASWASKRIVPPEGFLPRAPEPGRGL
jgi:hypothetical protein